MVLNQATAKMAGLEDAAVSDSTDWLRTGLPVMAAVEASLRCQVCKDFFQTPMITGCSHTFCSECIRRALSKDGRCPLCRASEQEIKLRPNWSMAEAVESFVGARPTVLGFATTMRGGLVTATHVAAKRKLTAPARDASGLTEHGAKRLRSSARRSESKQAETHLGATLAPGDPSANEGLVAADQFAGRHGPQSIGPQSDSRIVPCPSCQSRMKQWQVFSHLDKCPGPPRRDDCAEVEEVVIPSLQPLLTQLQHHPLTQRPHDAPERLAAINYSLLKEQALRKKLGDLGIPSTGPRVMLERRHREWLTIWNANCDAARPRRRGELLRDLEVWEKAQGTRTPFNAHAVDVRDGKFDTAAWASRHEASFKSLIAQARATGAQLTSRPRLPSPPQDEPQTVPESSQSVAKGREGPLVALLEMPGQNDGDGVSWDNGSIAEIEGDASACPDDLESSDRAISQNAVD